MKEDINIRAYRPDDLAGIKQLTVEAFAGVTLEENVEAALGRRLGKRGSGSAGDDQGQK